MKILRTMLLGSAGAVMLFVTGTVAQAADSPDAVKGREPVWRCDTAGFIEYPGSDWCFKIGGTWAVWIAHAEDQVETGGKEFNPLDINTDGTKTFDDTTWLSGWVRAYIDIRKASELGIVRLFGEFQVGEKGAAVGSRHVFIQLGNWLAGFTTSTQHQGYGRPTLFSESFGIPGDPESVPRVSQLRYTFKAGNGVEVNLAIEDPATNDGGYDALTASRNDIPDAAANIKVKTTWGGFGIGAAVHQHSATGFGGANNSRRPVGWGVIAGTDVNITPDDTLMVQGSFGHGFKGTTDNGEAFNIGQVGGPGSGTATTKTKTWGIVGGWEHGWGGDVTTTVAASYIENDYDGADSGLIGGFAAFHPTATIKTTSVWVNIVKTLVPGVDLGLEVLWGDRETADGLSEDAFGVSLQLVGKQ